MFVNDNRDQFTGTIVRLRFADFSEIAAFTWTWIRESVSINNYLRKFEVFFLFRQSKPFFSPTFAEIFGFENKLSGSSIIY